MEDELSDKQKKVGKFNIYTEIYNAGNGPVLCHSWKQRFTDRCCIQHANREKKKLSEKSCSIQSEKRARIPGEKTQGAA